MHRAVKARAGSARIPRWIASAVFRWTTRAPSTTAKVTKGAIGHDSRRERLRASQQTPKRPAADRRTGERKLCVVDRALGGGFVKRKSGYATRRIGRSDVVLHRMRGGAVHAPSFGEHLVRARVLGSEPGDARPHGRLTGCRARAEARRSPRY